MKKCLVLVVENSNTNIGAGSYWKNDEYKSDNEPLEEESIKCITSWYSNGPDIPIYIICPSNKQPREQTIETYNDLGCIYIHKYLPETDDFTCGYWNVPIALSWFEKEYDYDVIIHIDLDMYMFREPRPDIFDLDDGVDARIGILSQNEMKDIHIGDYEQHHETNFMVARNGFYTDWWEKVKELSDQYDHTWERYADIEEFAVDVMSLETHNIEPERDYQIGPRYPLDDIPDHMLDNVIFIHRHLYESEGELPKYGIRLWRYNKTKKGPVCNKKHVSI